MAHIPASQMAPSGFGGRTIDWDIEDPIGRSLSIFRNVRDEIQNRVRSLLDETLTPSAR